MMTKLFSALFIQKHTHNFPRTWHSSNSIRFCTNTMHMTWFEWSPSWSSVFFLFQNADYFLKWNFFFHFKENSLKHLTALRANFIGPAFVFRIRTIIMFMFDFKGVPFACQFNSIRWMNTKTENNSSVSCSSIEQNNDNNNNFAPWSYAIDFAFFMLFPFIIFYMISDATNKITIAWYRSMPKFEGILMPICDVIHNRIIRWK